MQTFLPYANFSESLQSLDYRRLGKQRVEAKQIINALTLPKYGWKNHPASLMWQGCLDALKLYHNTAIKIWVSRGYKNNMPLEEIPEENSIKMPDWFGLDKFHSSHRSNLLRKNFDFYSQFGWQDDPKQEYFWPTKR
jgi:hypothetical protein